MIWLFHGLAGLVAGSMAAIVVLSGLVAYKELH